jgi:hypothetical protein
MAEIGMESIPDVKPQTIDDYKTWMKATLGYEYDAKDETRYNMNMNSVLGSVSQHPFLIELEKELQLWSKEYKKDKGSDLFMSFPDLKSTIDKCFRHNVLWNERFPAEPKMGWITPVNVYSNLNDLIRMCFVCKFIDGPRFVTEKLNYHAEALCQEHNVYSQQREEGYYAYHFYSWFDISIVNSEWIVSTEKIQMEIQVTTQLQEILYDLTHPYFEISRIDPKALDEQQWKWETKSNRFRSAYMCHTLHLLEAVIIDLRDESN